MAYVDFLVQDRPLQAVVPSPTESVRFGMSVGRMSLRLGETTGAIKVRELIASSGFDLTILRYPAERVDVGACLVDDDLVSWQADTLLYFERDVGAPAEGPVDPTTRLRALTSVDAGLLEPVVRDVFAAYGSHYLSNPCLDPAAVLDGYVEWALGSAMGERAAALLLERASSGEPLALCTLDLRAQAAEISLAGVVSAARGRGIYQMLLDGVEHWISARGVTSVVISTQAGNRTPVRAWVRRGYQYVLGVDTVHVMSRTTFRRRRRG